MKKLLSATFHIAAGTVAISMLYAATINGWIDLPEMAVATNPATGFWRIFFKSDGGLYKRNSSGTETAIGGGGATLPGKTYLPAAGCAGTSASSAYDLPATSAPVAACYGASYKFGALDFDDTTGRTATVRLRLPGDWSGSVDARLDWMVGASAVQGKWTLATACVADDEDALNPTFNAAQTIAQTSSVNGNARSTASQAGLTVTGCSAGESLIVKVGRDTTDTSTATHSLLGVELTIGRQ